jgi:hypothetical protein
MAAVGVASLLVMRPHSRPSLKSSPQRRQLSEEGSLAVPHRGHVELMVPSSDPDPTSCVPQALQKAQAGCMAAEQAGQVFSSLVSLRRSTSV